MQPAPAPVASNRRQRLLASLLEKAGLQTAADRIPRRPAGSAPAPLSSGQRRMWFLDRVAPGNPVYNVPTCFRMRGPLDARAFQYSLNEIVRRHEILRTAFEPGDGEPLQVISDCGDAQAVAVDFRECGEAVWKGRAIEEARRPFNLAHAPLLRVALFRLAEEDHVVLITMHHIICDGWSMGVLFRELAALYSSAVRRVPAYLSDLPVQYADYALWQRERLDSGKLGPQVDYWRRHLRSAPTVFELPADWTRPQEPTFRGAVLHTRVDPSVSEALLQLAQNESTTPFVLLLAAYAVLLHRYSGQADFIVGCPVSNRNRSELEPLIGFLPNTLPLRIQMNGDPSFLTLVRDLRELTAEAFANAEAPFEAITDAAASSRSGHNPLFQVAFMMQEQPPARMTFGDVEITPIDLDLGTAKCDLTLVGANGPGGLSLAFEYSADLFAPHSIRRMAGHFQTLLAEIAANPEQRVSAIPLMSWTEKQQVLVDWSRTRTTEPDSRCLHQLVERHAALHPDAPALLFSSAITTYAELNRRANRIAYSLLERGAGPDALVAIALPRSPDLIAAILGVLKAGAAYLPLALDHPAGRISFQIEDARPMMLLTLAEHRRNLPAAARQIKWLDMAHLEPSEAEANPDRCARPSDAAYVIYTSGSTGRPKGTVLEHGGLTNLALAQQSLFKLGPGCRVLQFAPPAFDASVWEIAMALGSGGCLCLGAGAAFVPEELARVMQKQRVTTITLPPSILRTLTPTDFPELRTVISAGESCPEVLAREWGRHLSFFNAYGPTETTVCATAVQWQPSSQQVTIGRALPNLRTRILDTNMQPVPAGIPGELHIGGVGVARGYLNRPELTRIRFVEDPFEPGGGRLYKTGDLARYLSNGEIEFLGRIDGQVKIRGHRIEPGEIEMRLESHPAVRECAVVLRADAGREPRLIAYFVAHGPAPDNEELRTFTAQALPVYMVPSVFVSCPELPLNSSGKIDRRALAERDVDGRLASTPARDDLERTIADIWAEVLHIPEVGVTSNFFELGGNSLMAVNLIGKIAARTGCELPVTALFHAGTVEQMARCVRERRNSTRSIGSVVQLQPHGSKPPLVFVAPAGGSLICYSELARLLGPHQPVLGVEPARDAEPHGSVEAMAAQYIRDLRSASVDSPFHLAGWSFGGNIAFEMARQLAGQRRPVDQVFLLDSHAKHKNKEPDETELLIEIARVHALARGMAARFDRHRLRHLNPYDRALEIAAQMHREPGVSPETIATELRMILQRFHADMRAARGYAPGYYAGQVTLLRTSASLWSGDNGWSRLCANLEICEVPGTHRTLLAQPNVSGLASTLRAALARQVAEPA